MIKLKGGLYTHKMKINMNTNGKMSGAGIALAVIAVAAIVLVLGQMGYLEQFQSGTGGVTNSPSTCSDSTATLSFPAVDFYNQGTSVTSDPTVRKTTSSGTTSYVNGTSSTSFGVGDKLQVLYKGGDYIDATGEEFEVSCGLTSAPEQKLFATNTNTFRVFNTNNQLLTDAAAGGATNQSSSAAPISLELKIDSRTDQSTGDLVIVIESTNTTSTRSLTLSGPGAVKVSLPTFYTGNAALSVSEAYEVPAVVDGNTATYTLQIEPESGQTVGAGDDSIYVTAYSKQAFRDADGSFKVGIENSQGVIQYEDTWDFDFMIT